MRLIIIAALLIAAFSVTSVSAERLHMTKKWDKTFAKSDKVDHSKVTFRNRFGITLAADMYVPKNASGKLAAIAVSGPFGAVKEQSSGLYAQTMAERGFLTVAFDPSFTGESGGEPRYMNSPDFAVEDFQAAVDYLSNCDKVDPDRIGIIGICGWGGFALDVAALDTRIKATVASTMYNIPRCAAMGYNDVNDADARYDMRVAANAQRTADYKAGTYTLAGGVIDPLPADAPQFVKDYYAYYKTPRGYHKRSLNSNDGWAAVGGISQINRAILTYGKEIRSAVMVLHGEKAHSRYMGEDAYKEITEGSKYAANKELVIVPGASHCDLYDRTDIIPFAKLDTFFKTYLK
ncbi:MAG: alpha/beta hydrolase [Abditibacteriota bacterium]|nr:alpha/beta hydrolase [Abditibacteriota bacterium]